MFIPVKRRHILTLLMGVLLVSCSQNTTYPDTSIDTGIDTGREVLGIGSIDITLPSALTHLATYNLHRLKVVTPTFPVSSSSPHPLLPN